MASSATDVFAKFILNSLKRAWQKESIKGSIYYEFAPSPSRYLAGDDGDIQWIELTLANQVRIYADLLNWFKMLAEGDCPSNTLAAIQSDLKKFFAWCSTQSVRPLPCNVRKLCLYAESLKETHKVSTIRRYFVSIGKLHQAAGVDSPTKNARVRSCLRSIEKWQDRQNAKALNADQKLPFERHQAIGIHRDDLLATDKLFTDSLHDLRDRALLWTAYDTMARPRELIAMRIENMQRTRDGSGAIYLPYSRRNQNDDGRDQLISAQTMSIIKAWLKAAEISNGLLFRDIRINSGRQSANDNLTAQSLEKGNKKYCDLRVLEAMSQASFFRRFKKLVKRMHDKGILDAHPGLYSPHSLRVGAAQDMTEAGVMYTEIMRIGDWKSVEMLCRYTKNCGNYPPGGASEILAKMSGRA